MKIFCIFIFCVAVASAAFAGPGAHGPNGEHLDVPAAPVAGDSGQQFETVTESFELVGRLHDDGLSILIDRYETNEPVLGAKLDVELNGLTVPAKFHADHGDYSVDDKRFLDALATPGKHAMIFTLTTADESDLLEATLEAGNQHGAAGHAHLPWRWIGGGLLVALILMAIALRMSRSTSSRSKSSTGI